MKNPDDPRPRIGLVLGGGGARGAAHISIIKKLESLNIPIDCIAGTSMGALIGGLYASGMTSAELEDMIPFLAKSVAFAASRMTRCRWHRPVPALVEVV